jgi:hypothetical protein
MTFVLCLRVCNTFCSDHDNRMSEQQGFTPLAKEVNKWKFAHMYATMKFNVNILDTPPLVWGARLLDTVHAKRLGESFLQTGSVNLDGEVVIMNDELYGMIQTAEVLWETLMHFITTLALSLYLIGGNHTNMALKTLAQQYRDNPSFKLQQVSLLIVPDNEESRRQLRNHGNLLNQRHVSKSTKWNDVALQMHNAVVGEMQVNNPMFCCMCVLLNA